MNYTNLPAQNFFVLVNAANQIVKATTETKVRNEWMDQGLDTRYTLRKILGGNLNEAIALFNQMGGNLIIRSTAKNFPLTKLESPQRKLERDIEASLNKDVHANIVKRAMNTNWY